MRSLSAPVTAGPDEIGGKAHGLIVLRRLGLAVPPGFVIGPREDRAAGLDAALDQLDVAMTQELGSVRTVSVRSGAGVSMPGMMSTLLDVGRDQVPAAIAEVSRSWDTPRARTYRELHDIPHDLGTAVVVQAMVFGDRDARSGSGVAFSRDPTSGEHRPYGEMLFERRGDDVVSGRAVTEPLDVLSVRTPEVWAALRDALAVTERHYRDACYLEFTVESGRLWLLQARAARLPGVAGARVAVDLVEEGLIDKASAVRRVPPTSVQAAPRLVLDRGDEVVARGIGASPGTAYGRVALTADDAVRMAADGDGPVILVRPETSPLDLHGMAAAAGIVTARGGPASHAAVVARSMGKPAVVGVGTTPPAHGGHPAGGVISVDGGAGLVVAGRARIAVPDDDPSLRRLREWAGQQPEPTPPA